METTSSEEEQEPGFMPISGSYGQSRHGESPTDGRALRRSSRGSFTRGSLEDLLSLDPEAHQSSMWLGTEDGWYVPGVGIPTQEGPGPGGASSFAVLLQHPRVPVLGQHPEQEEQHEDATRCCRHVHPVSGEGGFSALGGARAGGFGVAEWGSAAGCQRWFVTTGTWITRSSCRWPTGSLSCTSGKQVRLDLGHQKCSPKVVAAGGWLGQPLGRDAQGGFHRKGHPWGDAGDPTLRGRWRWASLSWSPLRGDLGKAVFSPAPIVHIELAFFWERFNHSPRSPHLLRPLLGPPKLQVPVPGLSGEPHHQDGGGGGEAVVRLPEPSPRPQHGHPGTGGIAGGGGGARWEERRAAAASPWLCPPQHTLQVGQDGGRSVTCMVSAGSGVWVALQGSAQVRLYHASTYEQLAEADITPPVHKMLAGECCPGPASKCPWEMPWSIRCWEIWDHEFGEGNASPCTRVRRLCDPTWK